MIIIIMLIEHRNSYRGFDSDFCAVVSGYVGRLEN